MSWAEERVKVLRWIKSLPKPCGIFAVYDSRARFVLDVCREAEIKVPAQVQVLGVDNETYFCEYSTPTLSSISPDFEGGGFLAAQTLDALLEGRPSPSTNLFGIAEAGDRMFDSAARKRLQGSARKVGDMRDRRSKDGQGAGPSQAHGEERRGHRRRMRLRLARNAAECLPRPIQCDHARIPRVITVFVATSVGTIATWRNKAVKDQKVTLASCEMLR